MKMCLFFIWWLAWLYEVVNELQTSMLFYFDTVKQRLGAIIRNGIGPNTCLKKIGDIASISFACNLHLRWVTTIFSASDQQFGVLAVCPECSSFVPFSLSILSSLSFISVITSLLCHPAWVPNSCPTTELTACWLQCPCVTTGHRA